MKLKQLSRARKINAAIWAALTLATAVLIYCTWSYDNCCEGFELWAGVIVDSVMVAFLGFCCDCAIRDIEKKAKEDKYEYR